MDHRERLIRKHSDGHCLPCYALQGELTAAPPHAGLRLIASQSLKSGTLEQFTCETCRQTMSRFLAAQISPPPSDKWRYEQRAVSSFSGSSAPPEACADVACTARAEFDVGIDENDPGELLDASTDAAGLPMPALPPSAD